MSRCRLRTQLGSRSSGRLLWARRGGGPLKLWTTAKVAEEIGFSEDWVRDHAAELGGIRMGHPTRGQLRFEPPRIEAYKQDRRLSPQRISRPKSERATRRRGRIPRGVELLPLPDEASSAGR